MLDPQVMPIEAPMFDGQKNIDPGFFGDLKPLKLRLWPLSTGVYACLTSRSTPRCWISL